MDDIEWLDSRRVDCVYAFILNGSKKDRRVDCVPCKYLSHDIILQTDTVYISFRTTVWIILNGHTVGGLTVYMYAFITTCHHTAG